MTVSIGLGRVGSNFFSLIVGWVGLDWVSQLMGWVGLGHTKWTYGQLWFRGLCVHLWVMTANPTKADEQIKMSFRVSPRTMYYRWSPGSLQGKG